MVDSASQPQGHGVLEAGQVLDGRYEILHPIGEGGWATIYLARQCLVDRLVAVKVLTLSGSGDLNRLRDRFTQEARAAARVKHPHIVTIHDVGFVGTRRERPYIAMEYLEGHDLETELERAGGMTLERTLRLSLPCIQALGVGHAEGIIHRDLKPSNLFLVHPGTPREKMVVLDFGIAQVESTTTRLTEKGELFGTPAYLAPEWITRQECSAAVDVYQMGLILAEMVAGRPLVDAPQPYDCLAMHVNGQLPLPDIIVESSLGAVLARALAVDPARRYADCTVFYQALLESSASLVSLPTLSGDFTLDSHSLELAAVAAAAALAEGRTTRPGMTLPPALFADAPEAMALEQRRRSARRLWLAVAVLFALLAAAATAALLMRPGGDDDAGSARSADAPDTIAGAESTAAAPTAATAPAAALPARLLAAAAHGALAGGSPVSVASDMVLVQIDSRPQGARVSVGAQVLGTTPLEAYLPAGRVELEFRRRGFRTVRRPVEVEEGLRVNERLRKRSDGKDDAAAGDAAGGERIPVLP